MKEFKALIHLLNISIQQYGLHNGTQRNTEYLTMILQFSQEKKKM